MEDEQKIYVQPEKVMIMPEGIFLLNERGDFCPVRMVSRDGGGVFVVTNGKSSVCGLQFRHAPWCPYANLPDKTN